MENTEKFILRFYLALFSSIIFHSILLIALFALFPSLELTKKTIPFQLMSNDRYGQNSRSATLSKSENTLAAQEFLRTLNESTFDQLIRENTRKTSKNRDTPSPFKQQLPSESPFINKPIFFEKSNASNAFQGLQDIFSKKDSKQANTNNKQQISTQTLEELSQYEIQLLTKLAKDELYDEFHPVMSKNKQTNINYVITLNLFANGAIKSASIRQSSNIPEIDSLAIKAAYSASPFPRPPKEDIEKNFKYDIPIIYQKRVTSKNFNQ